MTDEVPARRVAHASPSEWVVDGLLGACFGYLLLGLLGAVVGAIAGPFIGQAPRARLRQKRAQQFEILARAAARRRKRSRGDDGDPA
jgi:uncharacterized membrane protein